MKMLPGKFKNLHKNTQNQRAKTKDQKAKSKK